MRILIVSSHGRPTGCVLRGAYLTRALQAAGDEAELAPPLPCMPLLADMGISMAPYVLRALRRRWDVVMAMKPFPNAGLAGILGRMRGAVFAVDVDDLDHGYRSGFMSRMIQRIQSPFPKAADLVTVHNDRLFQHVTEDLGVSADRVYRLDQGVDLSIFSKPAKRSETVQAWMVSQSIRPESPIILVVAHLNVACDLEPVLDIVSDVMTRHSTCHFVVAGGGPLASHYRSLADRKLPGGRTHFTGVLTPEDVAAHMDRATVCLVYYSIREVNLYRTSMKLREYLAMGKDVVANAFGDLADFRDFVYLAEDREAYTRLVLRLLECGGDGRSATARAHIEAHLDWTAIGRAFHHRLEIERSRRGGVVA